MVKVDAAIEPPGAVGYWDTARQTTSGKADGRRPVSAVDKAEQVAHKLSADEYKTSRNLGDKMRRDYEIKTLSAMRPNCPVRS